MSPDDLNYRREELVRIKKNELIGNVSI